MASPPPPEKHFKEKPNLTPASKGDSLSSQYVPTQQNTGKQLNMIQTQFMVGDPKSKFTCN